MSILGQAITVGGDLNPTAKPNDVTFIDYDGTIRYSYSASDFLALSALPPNPKHKGLTAQGWNWTLAGAKAHVAKYRYLDIAQGGYVPTDGKTHVLIELPVGALAPYLNLALNGTAAIDWGDGSPATTITGSNISSLVEAQHEYAAPGEYDISIDVTGSARIMGNNYGYAQLLSRNSGNNFLDQVYRNTIRRVHVSSNVSFYNFAAAYCYNLQAVTLSAAYAGGSQYQQTTKLDCILIPSGESTVTDGLAASGRIERVSLGQGITAINGTAFNGCQNLRRICLPDGLLSIGATALGNCPGLARVDIPSSVETIAANAFVNDYGLKEVHFYGATPPVLAGSSAFGNLPLDCVFYVPAGSLSVYQTATNYPDPSTYTYEEE